MGKTKNLSVEELRVIKDVLKGWSEGLEDGDDDMFPKSNLSPSYIGYLIVRVTEVLDAAKK